MGTASYFQEGDRLDYTPGVAVSSGAVIVQDNLVGAAAVDIAASRLGALALEGMFVCSKAAVAFAVGQKVYWDMTNAQATNDPSAGPLMGLCGVAALSGDATVKVLLDIAVAQDLLGAIIAAGTALTNNNAETTLGSFTIPANRLQVGDVIRFRAQGIAPATNSTDTLNVKAYLGTNNLCATGALDVANNDIFYIEGDIVVRTIGNAATGTIVAAGLQSIGTPGTATAKPWNFASANLDTTIAEILKITGTWSVANAGDSCRLDILDVELLRQQ